MASGFKVFSWISVHFDTVQGMGMYVTIWVRLGSGLGLFISSCIAVVLCSMFYGLKPSTWFLWSCSWFGVLWFNSLGPEISVLCPIHTADADEMKLFCHVGVGGVYMNLRRLPTDSAMWMHNAAVGRDPVYNTAANGSRMPMGVFTPTTRRNCRQLVANSCTHRRRDETRQFHLVSVSGVYWA